MENTIEAPGRILSKAVKRWPWDRPEAKLQSRAEGLLHAAGYSMESNRRISNGLEPVYADTIIWRNDERFMVIEYKKDSSTQSLMTALGQCVTYAHLLGLAKPGRRPFRRAVICVPKAPLSCVEDAAHSIGVGVCSVENLCSYIRYEVECLTPGFEEAYIRELMTPYPDGPPSTMTFEKAWGSVWSKSEIP